MRPISFAGGEGTVAKVVGGAHPRKLFFLQGRRPGRRELGRQPSGKREALQKLSPD